MNVGVYAFPLSSTAKERVKLSDSFAGGSIAIGLGSLTDNKSFEIDLVGFSITSESAYPIYHGSKESKLIVDVINGSENILETEGRSQLNLLMVKAGRGFRGDDLIFGGDRRYQYLCNS